MPITKTIIIQYNHLVTVISMTTNHDQEDATQAFVGSVLQV